MKRHVITESIKRTTNTIEGHFILNDRSKTQFCIDRTYGWKQWGNSKDNLYITVPRLEELQEELHDS